MTPILCYLDYLRPGRSFTVMTHLLPQFSYLNQTPNTWRWVDLHSLSSSTSGLTRRSIMSPLLWVMHSYQIEIWNIFFGKTKSNVFLMWIERCKNLDLTRLTVDTGQSYQVLVRRLFEDHNEHTLTLRLRVPPSSGFWAYYIHSPVVVIDRFIGESSSVDAPEWLQCQRLQRKFWQQRSLMLDLLLYFAADLAENHQIHPSVENWCRRVSVSDLLH